MPGTLVWVLVGVAAWLGFCVLVIRILAFGARSDEIGTAARVRAEPQPATEPALPVETGRRRILIVDDDPGLRLLLRTTLGLDEFAVEEASSAEEAAHIARFWLPAVVILDVALPGMDGLRFCRELNQHSQH